MTFFKQTDLAEKELLPGCRVRFVHSENLTIAYWTFDAGTVLPEHNHPHEQVMNLVEGDFELTVAGEVRRMSPGEGAVIAPDVLHAGRAVTDARVIDVFYPVREDYR